MVPLVVLVVLDGWGVAAPGAGNATSGEHVPNFNKYWHAYPHTLLTASGEAVGLPSNEAGNTETGHLNLGAGRIVYQDLLRINMSVADGSFFQNAAFLGAITHAKKNNSNLHLLGLIGAGNVHSNIEHLYALLRLCKEQGLARVFLHLFTDGRDSPPNSGASFVSQIEQYLKTLGTGKIATVMGRYWAMDRDQRWDRTAKAYFALTQGVGRFVSNVREAIDSSYVNSITDEFINPSIIAENGKPLGLIAENDAVIFFNYRIDRPRQLARAFVFEDLQRENDALQFDFDPYAVRYKKTHLLNASRLVKVFDRGPKIKNLFFVTMTRYGKPIARYAQAAFPPVEVNQTLGEVLSTRNISQLRLAESEKERFVTFYFNGQREIPFNLEDRKIIPSKKVVTYDLAPEMSAREITDEFISSLKDPNLPAYSFVLINFANADMVGHTGEIVAAKRACSVIDECLAKIVYESDLKGGVVLLTADHGNAEEMLGQDNSSHTEHTSNPVPFIVVGREFISRSNQLQSGVLADVAPSVLKLLGIPQPGEMTGRSLI